MDKNVAINVVAVLLILLVVGLGFNLYSKAKVEEPAGKIPINSKVGTLLVEELPVSSSTISHNNSQPVVSETKPAAMETKLKIMNKINIDTNFGKIVLELYPKDAPKAVENFVTLATKGFYDNLTFHRVIPGFMIQGGDPKGDGTGGPGYTFADELNESSSSYKAGYKKGVLAMANAGPNTNGSQFFIMLANYPLPHLYTIFGRVISGQEVVDAIGKTPTGINDRPIKPAAIKSVTVSE